MKVTSWYFLDFLAEIEAFSPLFSYIMDYEKKQSKPAVLLCTNQYEI